MYVVNLRNTMKFLTNYEIFAILIKNGVISRIVETNQNLNFEMRQMPRQEK